jgi:hypothetical protein
MLNARPPVRIARGSAQCRAAERDECADARYLPRPLSGALLGLVRARRDAASSRATPPIAISTVVRRRVGVAITRDLAAIDVDGGHARAYAEAHFAQDEILGRMFGPIEGDEASIPSDIVA